MIVPTNSRGVVVDFPDPRTSHEPETTGRFWDLPETIQFGRAPERRGRAPSAQEQSDVADTSQAIFQKLKRTIYSEAGREALATALDGRTAGERVPERQKRIDDLLDDLGLSGADVLDAGAVARPRVIAARSGSAFKVSEGPDMNILPPGVDVALVQGDDDRITVLVSNNLGFREIAVAVGDGTIGAIVAEAKRRGIDLSSSARDDLGTVLLGKPPALRETTPTEVRLDGRIFDADGRRFDS